VNTHNLNNLNIRLTRIERFKFQKELNPGFHSGGKPAGTVAGPTDFPVRRMPW
jgi:hypothetical protein